jgi:hypothetical protein
MKEINRGNSEELWCIKEEKEAHSIRLNMIRNNSCKWNGGRDRRVTKHPPTSLIYLSLSLSLSPSPSIAIIIERACKN